MTSKDILFRCSSLGHLMTDSRSKSELISDTTKTHLVDVFVSSVYKRREEVFGKAIEKGHSREEDSITLFSRVEKRFFKKNDVRLKNQMIQGEVDVFTGESIENAEETIDTKTSWSMNTFLRSKFKPLDKMYYWQGMGYMDLTGATKHTVAFCLVNSPANLILDEKRKLQWGMGNIDTANPEYVKAARQIEINHIFDIQHFVDENPGFDFDCDVARWLDTKEWDVPMEERVHTFTIKRDEDAIDALYKRIEDCRNWMDFNLFKTLKPIAA